MKSRTRYTFVNKSLGYMMISFRLLLLLFCVQSFIFVNIAIMGNERKQPDYNSIVSLGLTFSNTKYYSNTNFRNINYDNLYTDAGITGLINGKGEGYSVGLMLDCALSDRKQSNFSLTTRLQYSNSEHRFWEVIHSFPSKPVGGGQIFSSTTALSSMVTLQVLTCDVLMKWDIPGTKIGLTFGPSISNMVSSFHSLVYQLNFDVNNPTQFIRETEPGTLLLKQDYQNPFFGPGGYHPRYVDNSKTAIRLYEGELEYCNDNYFGLLLGLQLEVDLLWCSLVPYFQYNMGITNVVNVDRWNINALQLGLDYRVYL